MSHQIALGGQRNRRRIEGLQVCLGKITSLIESTGTYECNPIYLYITIFYIYDIYFMYA